MPDSSLPRAAPPPAAGAPARTLRSNFSWTLAAALLYALAQWGVLVAYAKLGGPAMLGQFALGLAVTAPVMLFARMELRPLQATDARGDFAFERYLALMVSNAVVGVAVCCLIGLVAGYPARVNAVIALLALAKAMENISEVYYGALQKHERMELVARSLFAKSLLSVALVALVLWATGSTVLAAGAMVLSWGAVLVLFDRHAYRREFGETHPWLSLWRTPLRVQAAQVHGLLRVVWALGFVALLGSLRPNVPRYIIEAHYGAAQLGTYAALAYFTALGGRIVHSMATAVGPRLGRYHAAGDRRRYGRATLGLACAAAAVGACAIGGAALLGRWVLTWVYGAAYAQNLPLFVWLMGAAALEYVCVSLQVSLTAARVLKQQMLLLGSSVVVVALASSYWVPRAGVVGAAWSMALGWATELSGSALLSVRVWRRLAPARAPPGVPGPGEGREPTQVFP